jgi:hypothetical protein
MMRAGPSGCCNLARILEPPAPGAAASILEGLDETLTVVRLGLPRELRRSLACTNIVENIMGSVRRVCRNAKRWRNASMALRWTAASMLEAAKGFRRRERSSTFLRPAPHSSPIGQRSQPTRRLPAIARRITSHAAASPTLLNNGRDISRVAASLAAAITPTGGLFILLVAAADGQTAAIAISIEPDHRG